MSKKQPVTKTGEPVDWDAVAEKHPKLVIALRCIGIELRSMMEAAVHPNVEEKKAKASESSVTMEAVGFTLRPSSTGREHFVEVIFPANPGRAVCAELLAAGFKYTRNIDPPHWYGHEDKLPARYRKENACLLSKSSTPISTRASEPTPTASEPPPTAQGQTVQPTPKTASDASSSCGEQPAPQKSPTIQKAESVNVPEPPALFVPAQRRGSCPGLLLVLAVIFPENQQLTSGAALT